MTEYNTALALKQARHALQLTQDAFAAALGIHQTTVARMEAGRLAIEPRTALAVECLLRRSKD